MKLWLKQFFCWHIWKPLHHSYQCSKCGKLDKEF